MAAEGDRLNASGVAPQGAGEPECNIRARARLAIAILCGFFLLLALRLVHLQVIRHGRLSEIAAQQQLIRRELSARRGNIYDRDGSILATSLRRWSVYADPGAVTDARATAGKLAQALHLKYQDVLADLSRQGRFAWIKRQASDVDADKVRRLRLVGVYLRTENNRSYPLCRAACQVVGFTDVDGRGLSGIELELDRILRAIPGREEVACDAARRPVRRAGDEPSQDPVDGYDVYLTIDSYVQSVAYQELTKAVEKHRPECAWAVVMDVRTGAILAMVSWPDFDPNGASHGSTQAQKIRPITDAYEFGSVMKPLTAAAALEEGLVTPDTKVDCHSGEWHIGKRVLHDVHPYGILTVSDIIAKSSNIGIAQVGLMVGVEKLHKRLSDFGLGAPTRIMLPGEIGGIMRPLPCWNQHSVISVSFGQELAATPLTVTCAFGTLANGGVLMRPRVIQKVVRSGNGDLVWEAGEPKPVRRVVSEKTASDVLAMMRRVVVEGTGKRADLKEYAVAGKTGTAGLTAPNRKGYVPGLYLSSFLGIAPVENPRIVVLVSLKAPSKNGYYGGTAAAPPCGEIIKRTLAYLKVPPSAPTQVATRSQQ